MKFSFSNFKSTSIDAAYWRATAGRSVDRMPTRHTISAERYIGCESLLGARFLDYRLIAIILSALSSSKLSLSNAILTGTIWRFKKNHFSNRENFSGEEPFKNFESKATRERYYLHCKFENNL